MILSASGWRKVFALSGNEQDKNPEISENDKKIAQMNQEIKQMIQVMLSNGMSISEIAKCVSKSEEEIMKWIS